MTVSPVQPVAVQHTFCQALPSKMKQVAEVIAQMAVRVLFVALSMMLAAFILPISFHAIAVPLVGISSAILSSFFFSKNQSPQVDAPPKILVRAPEGAPRGLMNEGNNCAFNSVIQFLNSQPDVALWMRYKLEEMDMAQFEAFLNLYNPPAELIQAFRDDFNAQPEDERPTVAAAFYAFMGQQGGVPAYEMFIEKMGKVYLVQTALSHIFENYDLAMQDNQNVVDANSQVLRAALHQIAEAPGSENPFSASSARQEDASEIFNYVFDLVPDAFKMTYRAKSYLDLRGDRIEGMEDGLYRDEEESQIDFGLSINSEETSVRLNDLYEQYVNEKVDNGESYDVEKEGVQRGNPLKRYAPDRKCIRFENAPPALRFCIKRTSLRTEKRSWVLNMLNAWLPFGGKDGWWPAVEPKAIKLSTSVIADEIMEITLTSGEKRRYQLASFVNHLGNDPKSGHYISSRIVNGVKYTMNDRSVTRASQQEWAENLQQAYLLCYLPLEE